MNTKHILRKGIILIVLFGMISPGRTKKAEVPSYLKGYENWWQSIMAEEPNERYGYIKVGSPMENPSRISAHDMFISKNYNKRNNF